MEHVKYLSCYRGYSITDTIRMWLWPPVTCPIYQTNLNWMFLRRLDIFGFRLFF